MIDISKLTKDIRAVHSALRVMPDRSVVAVKKVSAYFPKQFEKGSLAEISDIVTTILMVGLVVGDKYCAMTGLTRIVMRPGDIREEVINGDRYYALEFEPGDVVLDNLTVPQDSNITYSYYMDFTKYARIPWYINDSVLLATYDEAKFFTGKAVGTSNQAIRALYSLTMRDPKNLDIQFRYSPDFNNLEVKPRIIGINNPGQLLNSTFSRISSGYMADNIVAGILNPDTKVTALEEVIRGLPSGVGETSNV